MRTTTLVECLREIHDATTSPVILIGMPGIDKKIDRWPQVERRMTQRIAFDKCDAEDTARMARELCEVEVEPNLLDQLKKDANGTAGKIAIGLDELEKFARRRGIDRVTAEAWGPSRFSFAPASSGGR